MKFDFKNFIVVTISLLLLVNFTFAIQVEKISLVTKSNSNIQLDKNSKIMSKAKLGKLRKVGTSYQNRNATNAGNATKSEGPAKCGRSVGKIPQEQIWIPNAALDFLPKEDIEKHTINTQCTMYSGLIYMVEKATSYKNEIKLVQIYVKADTSRIQFFQSLEPDSKFHDLAMENFIKIGQNFKNTTCFDIVSSSKPDPVNMKDDKNKRGSLTLCTLSVKDEQNWVRGLMSMKECVSGKGNLLADFSSVNHSIEDAKKVTNANSKSPLSNTGIYYTNGGGVYEEYAPIQHEVGKITVRNKFDAIGRATEAIQETIKESTLKEMKIKKDLAKKLLDVKNTQKSIAKKKEIIQRLIESREIQEKKSQETLSKQEHDNRQLSILKKANEEIKKVKVIIIIITYIYNKYYKDDEIEQVKKSFDDKINEAKKKSNLKALEILKCIKDENKNNDPAECLDSAKLNDSESASYIEKLCLRFYGEAGVEQCKSRNHFCNKCCSHFIGIKFTDGLNKCKQDCGKVIEPHVVTPDK